MLSLKCFNWRKLRLLFGFEDVLPLIQKASSVLNVVEGPSIMLTIGRCQQIQQHLTTGWSGSRGSAESTLLKKQDLSESDFFWREDCLPVCRWGGTSEGPERDQERHLKPSFTESEGSNVYFSLKVTAAWRRSSSSVTRGAAPWSCSSCVTDVMGVLVKCDQWESEFVCCGIYWPCWFETCGRGSLSWWAGSSVLCCVSPVFRSEPRPQHRSACWGVLSDR